MQFNKGRASSSAQDLFCLSREKVAVSTSKSSLVRPASRRPPAHVNQSPDVRHTWDLRKPIPLCREKKRWNREGGRESQKKDTLPLVTL
jgi:hypothetical protein